jgi:hypothetical protein
MGFHMSSPNIGFVDFYSAVQYFAGVENAVLGDTDPDPQIEIVDAEKVNAELGEVGAFPMPSTTTTISMKA